MALFHTSPYHPWMLYKTLQVGYCLGTATHKRLLWSEAVISFPWVSVHVSALKVTWLYSGESGKFSQKLVKKNRGYFCPATFYPPAPFRFSSYFWPPSPPSFFLGTNTSPTLLGSQALFHWLSSSFVLGTDRPTVLSSFVVTFKKRCLYSFIGICGTWMHRFAFWKFYLKPGLITSFRSALKSFRMDVRKHWSLSGLITFSMLAESLRSFDLSRKIKGDSVRRVIDQILGSYLLSCVAFSVYEVVRVTCLSPSWFIYISPGA